MSTLTTNNNNNNNIKQNPKKQNAKQKDEKQTVQRSSIYLQNKMNIKLINDYKQLLFHADLGHYYRVLCTRQFHVKRIKGSQICKILNIADLYLGFQKTSALSTQEFNSVRNLSDKIDNAITLRKKNISTSQFDKIQRNCFLKYYKIQSNHNYGCFLIHEPILITLDQLIKKGTLTYKQKLQIFSQILKIMEFLQQMKIAHRCITSFCFVFVPKNVKLLQTVDFKNWKYNKQECVLKISGFYQSTIIGGSNHPNIICKLFSYSVENIYTDPNIYEIKPCFASDLWSVMILFYEMITGKVPHLNNKAQMEEQMAGMVKWQHDLFTYTFKGTKSISLTLKDLKMRVKNMQLTSDLTTTIIKTVLLENIALPSPNLFNKQQQSFLTTTTRKRATSLFLQNY